MGHQRRTVLPEPCVAGFPLRQPCPEREIGMGAGLLDEFLWGVTFLSCGGVNVVVSVRFTKPKEPKEISYTPQWLRRNVY